MFLGPLESTHELCFSLLSLLPEEAKSSYQMADSGYDTYLRDAHKQVGVQTIPDEQEESAIVLVK